MGHQDKPIESDYAPKGAKWKIIHNDEVTFVEDYEKGCTAFEAFQRSKFASKASFNTCEYVQMIVWSK
jgi:hypothetical protein